MIRFATGTLGFALLSGALVGCGVNVGVDPIEEGAESAELLTGACPTPAKGTGAVCKLGGGSLKYQVTLASGQQHVEIFVRQNGIQNVATSIVASARDNGNGTSTYAFTKSGYGAADDVEYRFYSYLPNAAAKFVPGPAERIWYRASLRSTPGNADLPVTKDATLILSSYCCGFVPNKNFGANATVDVASYHHDARALFGYALAGVPAGATITKAQLVVRAASVSAGNGIVDLSQVDDSASWAEPTVTFDTAPASTLVARLPIRATGETRLDVTAGVAAVVAAGTSEVSFFLAPVQDNIFIDSKEKVGGKPTVLHVEWQ